MVEGGLTPVLPRERLEAMGYRVAIYPVTLLFAAADAMLERLGDPSSGPRPWDGSLSFDDLKDLVGFPEWEARAERSRS